MSEKTMWENLQAFGIKKALHYLDDDPDVNIPKLLNWVDFQRRHRTLRVYPLFRF